MASKQWEGSLCGRGGAVADGSQILMLKTVREGNLEGTPSEASRIPCLTGRPKVDKLGDLICSVLVSQGTSWRIEEDFARLCQRDVPFKCLLICWAPEREAPDSKDLSIYIN